jgi:putative phosphoesterase
MRLIIASDIHGSAKSAKAVIEKAKAGDKIILLGDIYNHGPRNPLPEGWAPMELAALLNQNKNRMSVIFGNCDSEVDQMISEFPFKKKLTLKLDRTLFFSHGHKFNAQNPPKNLDKGSAVFYGHFHIPFIKEKDGLFFINPGSCALPFENHPKSYAVYDNGQVTIMDLNDNIIMQRKL